MQHLMDASSKTCFDNRCLSTNADPSARRALGLAPAVANVDIIPSCQSTCSHITQLLKDTQANPTLYN